MTSARPLRALALVLPFLLALPGCPEPTPAGGDASPDTIIVDDRPGPADGGLCTGTRDEVEMGAYHTSTMPACPDKYEQAVANPPTCGAAAGTSLTAGTCGGEIVLHADCGLHGFYCMYNETSHSLVGEIAYDDTFRFCSQTSSCIAYGTLPGEVSCTYYGPMISCTLQPFDLNDAGAGDAGDAGDVDASDAETADVQPFDAGPYNCGTQTCAGNQVCVHPCSGGADTGAGQPDPVCVDVPSSCGAATCGCVQPAPCQPEPSFNCREGSAGSRDLYCVCA